MTTMVLGHCSQLSDEPCFPESGSPARKRPLKERIDFDLELTDGAVKSIREYYKDWPEVLEALDEEIEQRQKAGSMESPKQIAKKLAELQRAATPPNMILYGITPVGSAKICGSVTVRDS